MAQSVVTQQPGRVTVGKWSTDLCDCCHDMPVCLIGTFCPMFLGCYAAHKYGEIPLLACVPGSMTALRTHVRLTYGIEGSLCNDALMVFCCGLCEICRVTREIRIRTGDHN
uniref:Cornifelin n=2 Tax=Latimeria chalumnae TaxID=7897 RepID=M3XI71_LATCH